MKFFQLARSMVFRLFKQGLAVVAFSMFAASASFAAEEEFLDPTVAFKFSAKMADASHVEVTYVIADGYYMYRERFAFRAENATLGQPVYPAGKVKFDETMQKNVESYRQSVTIRVPVTAAASFKLIATSQGCADKGLCYAPLDSEAALSTAGGATLANAILMAQQASAPVQLADALSNPSAAVGKASSESPSSSSTSLFELASIKDSLKNGKLLTILPLFFLLGLGLSLTPCVLPMIPILSSIIVGEGKQVRGPRGFLLALTYSLGMALVYTALGVGAGLAGEGLAGALQNVWVLSGFALLMVVLSLSMFGYYELQVPCAVQGYLAKFSDKQAGGKLIGVFVMGAISALIVGPCVAAPLASALLYISQTRDVFIGGSALFVMAMGMSVPLLLIGLSAGWILPRTGLWMVAVKQCFGVLMLAVAWWMLSPVLPGGVQMLGWSVLGIAYGSFLLHLPSAGWKAKAAGIAIIVLGSLQLVGFVTGGRDPLSPMAHFSATPTAHVKFNRVRSITELDARLAQSAGKVVMLDFYADWCVSCKEMEKLTFSEPRVAAQLAQMVLLQIDVTANSAEDKALLKRFNLFGPPGIIFFDRQGTEIKDRRVIGYQNPDQFLGSIGSFAAPSM